MYAFCMTDLKIDMKVVDVGAMSWAGTAYDSIRWMSALKKHLDTAREGKLMTVHPVAAAGKRARKQENSSPIRSISDPLIYIFILLNIEDILLATKRP